MNGVSLLRTIFANFLKIHFFRIFTFWKGFISSSPFAHGKRPIFYIVVIVASYIRLLFSTFLSFPDLWFNVNCYQFCWSPPSNRSIHHCSFCMGDFDQSFWKSNNSWHLTFAVTLKSVVVLKSWRDEVSLLASHHCMWLSWILE